ncbi:MAG TPA: PIN domain-containing protein [Thermoflexus sp.]|nr:PIN domain-containing protein [Thermoflexus sp.]
MSMKSIKQGWKRLFNSVMRKRKRKILVFDTSVLINYLRGRDLAADAFAKASEVGEIWLTIVSLLELHPLQKSNVEIQADLKKVEHLQKAYRLKVVPIPSEAQWFALNEIALYHRSTLGKCWLLDSLILGCGIKKNIYLVTEEDAWVQLTKDAKRPLDLQVIKPTVLVQDA